MLDQLKQLKELRDRAKRLREVLAQESITAGSDRAVAIVMDGNQEALSVSVNPDLLTPTKKEDLEYATREAVTEAVKKSQQLMARTMQESGDFRLPNF